MEIEGINCRNPFLSRAGFDCKNCGNEVPLDEMSQSLFK